MHALSRHYLIASLVLFLVSYTAFMAELPLVQRPLQLRVKKCWQTFKQRLNCLLLKVRTVLLKVRTVLHKVRTVLHKVLTPLRRTWPLWKRPTLATTTENVDQNLAVPEPQLEVKHQLLFLFD